MRLGVPCATYSVHSANGVLPSLCMRQLAEALKGGNTYLQVTLTSSALRRSVALPSAVSCCD
jgi:hypothetical protein